MTKSFKLIGALLFVAALAFSQTTVTSTTLSAAVDASQSVIYVASGTGFNVPSIAGATGGMGSPVGSNYTVAFVDKEAMRILVVSPPGTSGAAYITVQRGTMGTAAASHLSGAKVWVQPARYYALQEPVGSCNSSIIAYLPKIVVGGLYGVGSGSIWNCTGTTGTWVRYVIPGSNSYTSTVVASGTTIAPTFTTWHMNGTSAVSTITVPPGFPVGGQMFIIPDAAFTFGTGGNIYNASTATANRLMIITWDGVKWSSSY